jgi:hypothetical protein
MEEYSKNQLFKIIMNWLRDETKSLRDLTQTLPPLLVAPLIQQPIQDSNLQRLDIYSKIWTDTIDTMLKILQENVRRYVERLSKKKGLVGEEGVFVARFDIKKSIGFHIRRNLFESRENFQAKDFGFEINYNDARKTLRDLIIWIEGNDVAGDVALFLLIFVTCYMIINNTLREAKLDPLYIFWRELPLKVRSKTRSHLYDAESWVLHPLTAEEDEEYFIQKGEALLEPKKRREDAEKKRREDEYRVIQLRLFLANTKICIDDADHIIKTMDYVAKNYHDAFAQKYISAWNDSISGIEDLSARYENQYSGMITLGLLNNATGRMTPVQEDTIEKVIQSRFREFYDKTRKLFDRYKRN